MVIRSELIFFIASINISSALVFHMLNSEMRKYKSVIHPLFSNHLIKKKKKPVCLTNLWDSSHPTGLRDTCKVTCSREQVVGGIVSKFSSQRTDCPVFINHLPSQQNSLVLHTLEELNWRSILRCGTTQVRRAHFYSTWRRHVSIPSNVTPLSILCFIWGLTLFLPVTCSWLFSYSLPYFHNMS